MYGQTKVAPLSNFQKNKQIRSQSLSKKAYFLIVTNENIL
jgi:hypothetical protein